MAGVFGKTGTYPRTEEMKKNMREARARMKLRLGYVNSPETRKKMAEAKAGKVNPNVGVLHTSEVRAKIDASLKQLRATGHVLGMSGKTHTEETRIKISVSRKGKTAREKNPNWQGGTHRASHAILSQTLDWKLWRKRVFDRDNYTCQECGVSGVYIEPHHIVPIRSDREKLFSTNNGITLCRPCHQKTIWKESDFAEKYSRIVAAH